MTHDLMHHAPQCERPGTTTERGHSVTLTRCLGCGAITTTRNIPSTTTRKKD
jgi:hypothetical protein